MRSMERAYSHHGHGPRADRKGRIHRSDFRKPADSLLRHAAGPYIWVNSGCQTSSDAWSAPPTKAEGICQKADVSSRISCLSGMRAASERSMKWRGPPLPTPPAPKAPRRSFRENHERRRPVLLIRLGRALLVAFEAAGQAGHQDREYRYDEHPAAPLAAIYFSRYNRISSRPWLANTLPYRSFMVAISPPRANVSVA